MSPVTATPPRKGLLLILSSPSGAGKSTLARRLLESDEDVEISISATTRPPRPGEKDGREYHFVTLDRFEEMAAAGDLLEHATVFANRYGTPQAPVARAIEAGRDVLFDVDWQGAQQLRASPLSDSIVSIFILPPSIAELRRRLEQRAQDPAEVVRRRMAQSWSEISHWSEYDYVLVNEDVDTCLAQITAILAAERLRPNRQTHLEPLAARLSSEFEELSR
jgi:guanylate kinase